jgi:alpha-glucosidase
MTSPSYAPHDPSNRAGEDPEWWRGAVIYQIYPRSFQDTNEDGVGDLAGITQRMDYIASIGVDAIWISPFYRSPMLDFGYDISDYCDVDPIFGTNEDFQTVLDAAHAHGIKVLIDMVISHTSDRHSWFAESRTSRTNPKADWYVWVDPQPDGMPPNNWLSIFGGSAWNWDTGRRQYYMHNFLVEQPDLNYHNPEVQDAVLGVARYWLDRGVDGFRLDTVNMYFHDAQLRSNPPCPPDRRVAGVPEANPYAMQDPIYNLAGRDNLPFLRRLRELMDSYGRTMAVGELGAITDIHGLTAAYTRAGEALHMAYSFDLLTHDYSAGYIRRSVEAMEASLGSGWASYALTNHDWMRVVTRWGVEPYREQAGPMFAALVTSLRGTACLYQGEELALPEAVLAYEDLQDPYGKRFWPDFKGRDGCRTPMPWVTQAPHAGFSDAKPWLPMYSVHASMAVDRQDGDQLSPLNRVRRFLAWRKSQPALLRGSITFHDAPEPILAFTRALEHEAVLCVFNLGATHVDWRPELETTFNSLHAEGFSSSVSAECEIGLEPFQAFFGRLR